MAFVAPHGAPERLPSVWFTVMLVRLVQPENAELEMLVTPAGMAIAVRDVQFLNALELIVFSAEFKVTEARSEHPLKA